MQLKFFWRVFLVPKNHDKRSVLVCPNIPYTIFPTFHYFFYLCSKTDVVKFINNLKYKYGLYRLRKDFRNPESNAIVCNLDDAKSVGIIYNATTLEDFVLLRDFVFKLKKYIPEVKTLGYVDDKELSNFHIQPLEFSFFCRKNLNKYYKPHEDSVDDFVKNKFDILMDFNLNEQLPVRFVLAESEALFKTGRHCEIEPNYYDLMIQYNFDAENPLANLMEQTEYYLKMIKPIKK